MAGLHSPYILIALPCYNESENIGELLKHFDELAIQMKPGCEVRVLVIDDASTDDLKSAVDLYRGSASVTYLRHPQNRGLTGGLITAFAAFHEAVSSGAPPLAVGLMDGDNSHNPLTILTMLQKIYDGYDVVVASRFQPGSKTMGVVWWRQLLSGVMAILFKICRNMKGIRDYSCGYRLYSASLVKKLYQALGAEVVREQNFACMVELLRNCHDVGAVMTEVPFLLRYDLKKGDSKMRFFATIRGTLRVLFRGRAF